MFLAILQARLSSTRLPGKVLKPLMGKTMLERQIDRIKLTEKIDKIIVATSEDESDNQIEDLCKEIGIDVYRGRLEDVLDRFYEAAKQYNTENIVRLTGDCPLFDPKLADNIITYYNKGEYDYVSNTIEPTFPDGLDVEVFKFSALEKAWKESSLSSEREHVTPYIHKNPKIFKLGNYENNVDLSFLRWTVDERLDYELVRIIYEKLYKYKENFSTNDILKFLEENPILKTYNTMYQRNEGYYKSLKKDIKK